MSAAAAWPGPLQGVWPFIALATLSVIAVLFPWIKNRWQYRAIPGPFSLPFIGNLPAVLRHGGLHTYVEYCGRKYGKVFKIYLGSNMMIVITDPDLGRRANYRYINRNLGRQLQVEKQAEEAVVANGLVAVKDERWRTLRLAWQPAFQPGSLEAYGGLMDECAVTLGDLLGQAADSGEVVNVWRELGKMTMQVVGTTAYGVDFHTMSSDQEMSPEAHQLVHACMTIFSSSGVTKGSIYFLLLVMFPFLKPLLERLARGFPDQKLIHVLKARKIITNTSLSLIQGWKQSHQEAATASRGPATADGHTAAAAEKLAVEEEPQLVSSGAAAVAGAAAAGAAGTPDTAPASPTSSTSADALVAPLGVAAAAKAAPWDEFPSPKDTGETGTTPSSAGAAKTTVVTGFKRRGVGVDPGSFLGLMLTARSKETGELLMNDKVVTAQSNTFILAGYETTANTLAFCIYNIAANPEVQQRLLAEVDAFGRDRAPTPGELHKFSYVEGVVKESLRLFPPATIINREVKGQPLEILPNVVLKEPDSFFTAHYCYQRDEQYWRDALSFKPERFLPEGAALGLAPTNPNAYSPFGIGPRMCIGWKFAMQEAKIALIRLYQRYTFELEPGQVPLVTVQTVTMSPKGGVYVRVVRRQ